MRRALIAFAVAAGCSSPPPRTVEPVRVYVAPGLPGDLALDLARRFEIALPARVATVEEAEVAWLRSPTDVLALGERARPGGAPDQPGIPDELLDPKRRFVPVGAVAQVIVGGAAVPGRFAPTAVSELADPRLRGRVALPRLDAGDGPLVVAALELGYGERGTRGFLRALAANRPQLVRDEAEAIARVAAGDADVALVGSLAAGPALGSGLKITFTDQRGSGCVAIPTALVVLPGAGHAAHKFAAWLAGPTAERVLVDRAIGLLPVRRGAAAPPGIEPYAQLTTLTLQWEALSDGERRWRDALAGWPGP